MGGYGSGLLGSRLPEAQPGGPDTECAICVQGMAESRLGPSLLEVSQPEGLGLHAVEQLHEDLHGAVRPPPLLLLGLPQVGSRQEPWRRGGAQVPSSLRCLLP